MAASLYRRHRPRTFADVVGQEHVVRTLSNAIEQGRVHHAYLFVGSRGTGKTSMAKILAASLNCQGEAGGGTGPSGPTITPCGTCESCRSIATATSLDVVEMDAASNNSVDDIRDLRERVGYAPVGGGYKVYILDEAHMLTSAAWNAFLKTLEEPPPHTIFVLATTEANKVLPTVVDRCHRFDFGRPSVVQIASVLRRAAISESIEIPDEAIALVARSATGSFRDALGTLEQLLAYSGSSIVLDDVLAVLGAADADLLFGTLDAISAGDARSALLAAARLADSGRDLGRFFGDLEAHARGLLITQVLGAVPAELSVTPEQDERLAEQSKRVGGAEIVRLLELIANALRAMKDGADPRTQLELALVKAAKPDLEPTVKALQARIARLESAPPAPAPPRTPDRPETPAGRATSAPSTPSSGTPAPGPASADRGTPAHAAGTPAHAAATPAPATTTP
ncbi:DNA polymerase III subunit gamma/tau, partial [Solirubrobacter ginsenosidimutans]